MTITNLGGRSRRAGWPSPLADHHVHSRFSDGTATPAENVTAAARAGLESMVLVDHVRASTAWLPDFVRTVNELRLTAPLELRCGVEAKILDCDGHLDLPDDLDGVEILLVADHQLPTPTGPQAPEVIAAALRAGELRAVDVVGWLLDATCAAVAAPPRRMNIVLAHLFSVLPKVGLSEDDVPDDALAGLAARCAGSGAWLELNEKWGCPGPRVVAAFVAAGVPLVFGSDAHAWGAIGQFERSLRTLGQAQATMRHPRAEGLSVVGGRR